MKKSSSSTVLTSQLKYRQAYLILFFSCFILYGNTLRHEFVLDDVYYITAHSQVKKGLSGLPAIFTEGSAKGFNENTGEQLYRPVTLMTFAVDNSISKGNPHYFHLINVLLYAVVVCMIFYFLTILFPEIHHWLLFFITMLFASHPIHTEVVANIKSRDELLAALFGIWSLNTALRNEPTQINLKRALFSGVLLLLACLSKESAITLVAVFPMALVVLRKVRLLNALKRTIPLLLAAVCFLLLRKMVLSSLQYNAPEPDILLNLLYSAKNASELLGTRLELLFVYFKLLLIPYPLSWDYSYSQLQVVPVLSPVAVISALLHLGLLIGACLQVKRKPVFAFGIFFYFITFSSTSNFFLKISATVGERFLFLPSLSFAVLLLLGITGILKMDTCRPDKKHLKTTTLMVAAVLLGYCSLTIARNREWKTNFSLFEAGTVASPNSTRTHAAFANELHNKARMATNKEEQMDYMNRTVEEYRKSASLYPANPFTNYNLAIVYQELGDTLAAIRQYQIDLNFRPQERNSSLNLSLLYAYTGKLDSAEHYLLQILASDSSDRTALTNLTSVYLNNKKPEAARSYGAQAIRHSPEDPVNYLNMANVEFSLGKKDSADYFYSIYKTKGGN